MSGPVDVHEYVEANGGVWATEKLPEVSKPQSAIANRERDFMHGLLKRCGAGDTTRSATLLLWQQ
jgi:hypothetical protein